MIDEPTQESAALYALGLLEGAEARAFEEACAGNAELKALVAELQAAGDALAASAPAVPPPPELKGKILNRVQADIPQDKSRGASAWMAWAAAGLLLASCVALLLERAGLKREVSALRTRDALARMEINTLHSLLAQAPNADAVVVWDPEKQTGVINVANLPPTAPDQDYQLWLVDPEYDIPVDAGVFHGVDGKIRFQPKKTVHSIAKIAVSLERKGGVAKAQGPMVLISN